MERAQVIIFLASLVVNSISSAQWKALPNTNFLQGHSGECYDSQMQLGYMKNGESKTNLGSCVKATCLEDGSILYNGTMPGKTMKKTKLIYADRNREVYLECPALINCPSYNADSSKPYPHCCPVCM